jgi:tetratricopeptide (TPR) repeat protein
MQAKVKGLSKEQITENWINSCVDKVKLAAAVELLSKDESLKSLQRKASERNQFLNRTPTEEERKKAEDHKIQGNDYVKKEDYQGALEQYTKSININPRDASGFSNRALCYIKIKEFKKALVDANCAISVNRTNLRGYQRRAEAYLGLEDYKNAYISLDAILKEEPSHNIVFFSGAIIIG